MNGVPASLSAQRQPQEHSGWDLNTEEFILQLKFLFQSQRCFPCYIEHNHAVSQDLFFPPLLLESKYSSTSLLPHHPSKCFMLCRRRTSDNLPLAPAVSSHTEQSSLSSRDWAHAGGSETSRSIFINHVKCSTGLIGQQS